MKLSVVIPAYNEVETIDKVVDLVNAVEIDKGVTKELIIVDDASTDGTGDRLEEIRRTHDNVKVIRHEQNQGKGAALRTGFAAVTGDVVIIQDADLELNPAEYPTLLRPILAEEAEVVYGSRFMNNAGKRLSTGYLANWFLTKLTNCVTGLGITDMETGYKVFRSHLLKKIHIRSNRFGIEPEITVKFAKNGCRIREVPVVYEPRARSEGKKINWKDGIKAVFAILWFRLFD